MAHGLLSACLVARGLIAAAGLSLHGGLLVAGPPQLEEVLQNMHQSQDDASVQRHGCESVGHFVRLTQEQFEHSEPNNRQTEALALGADVQVIDAMRRFPQDAELQKTCVRTLAQMAQWNRDVSAALGEHGAVEAMTSAIMARPSDPDMLMEAGCLGSLTDWANLDPRIHKNLVRVADTGFPQMVLEGIERYSDNGDVVIQGLCFFSNGCLDAGANAQMLKAGYLEDSVRFMRQHRYLPGVTGEVIWVNLECFSDSAELRNRQADAGFLGEVVATLRDANRGFRTDVLYNGRMFANAMALLGTYALFNQTHRALITQAGAEGEILAALRSGLVKRPLACSCLAALGGPAAALKCAAGAPR